MLIQWTAYQTELFVVFHKISICLNLSSFKSLFKNGWDLADEKQLFSKRTIYAILYWFSVSLDDSRDDILI